MGPSNAATGAGIVRPPCARYTPPGARLADRPAFLRRRSSGPQGVLDPCARRTGKSLTDLLGSSGLLLVASAAIFGPLAGWLAGRRGRNAIVWFVFGALLGPLAVLLLAISPPGRCPLCDSWVPGWTAECQVCGGPLSPRLGATIHPTRVVRPRPSDPAPSTPGVERVPVVQRASSHPPSSTSAHELPPRPCGSAVASLIREANLRTAQKSSRPASVLAGRAVSRSVRATW